MKILIVTHYFLPHKGGIEFVAYNQAKELVKRGHQVTIVSSKIGDELEEEIMDGIKVRRVKAWNWFEDKIGVAFPIFSLNLPFILKEEIKDKNIVQIHGIWCISYWLSAFISKLYNRKIIITEHVGIIQTKSSLVRWIQKIVFYIFGKPMLKSSKKIIVCNEEIGNWINKKDKTIFLRNGVDTSLFYPLNNRKDKINLRKRYKLPLNKKIVLFVGRLVEKKGFDKLFEARDKNYFILFVGEGEVPKNMQEDKNVLFLDGMSQEKLSEVYKASDIFCLPSTNEGFPLTILEAMASGLPIITTNHPGYENYLDKEQVGLINPIPIEIKELINEILKNKDKMNKMSKYSREEAVKRFNWSKNTANLLEVYKK